MRSGSPARSGDSASGYTQLSLTLAGAPQSAANLQTIADLRTAYAVSVGPTIAPC